jgi:hypothetical protein
MRLRVRLVALYVRACVLLRSCVSACVCMRLRVRLAALYVSACVRLYVCTCVCLAALYVRARVCARGLHRASW